MTPERWRRIEELYHSALDLERKKRDALFGRRLPERCGMAARR